MSNTNSKPGRKPENLAGRVFGRLTALNIEPGRLGKKPRWVCQCACGGFRTVLASSLKRGHTRSCGCISRDMPNRHGMVGTPEYRAWYHMWERCTNPKDKRFSSYKGRVPPQEWKDFSTFLADMGTRPGPGYSLDRIDNDKPYGPGNCRWATTHVQRRNSTRVTPVVFEGEIMCLSDAASAAGISRCAINKRLKRGMSLEEASGGLLSRPEGLTKPEAVFLMTKEKANSVFQA